MKNFHNCILKWLKIEQSIKNSRTSQLWHQRNLRQHRRLVHLRRLRRSVVRQWLQKRVLRRRMRLQSGVLLPRMQMQAWLLQRLSYRYFSTRKPVFILNFKVNAFHIATQSAADSKFATKAAAFAKRDTRGTFSASARSCRATATTWRNATLLPILLDRFEFFTYCFVLTI